MTYLVSASSKLGQPFTSCIIKFITEKKRLTMGKLSYYSLRTKVMRVVPKALALFDAGDKRTPSQVRLITNINI